MNKVSMVRVFKYAGAVIAFIIGSGFASGQEVIQFLTSYGTKGIIGGFISMALFSVFGAIVIKFGFNKRENEEVDVFRYYCGKVFGAFMRWYTPFFAFLIGIVMISGSGATVSQYFNVPSYYGTLGMSVIVFVTTLFGLTKLVDIIGLLGPLTIIFTIVIGILNLMQTPVDLTTIDATIANTSNVPFGVGDSINYWWLAAILFVAYNIVAGVPFMAMLGETTSSARESVLVGVFTGIALMASAMLLNFAMLGHFEAVSQVEVPVLYLAQQISPWISAVFVFILLEEIFSTAAPMIWTVANALVGEQASPKKYRIVIFALVVATFIGGQLPFGQLVGIIYPLTGYIGMVMLALIIIREVYDAVKAKKASVAAVPVAND